MAQTTLHARGVSRSLDSRSYRWVVAIGQAALLGIATLATLCVGDIVAYIIGLRFGNGWAFGVGEGLWGITCCLWFSACLRTIYQPRVRRGVRIRRAWILLLVSLALTIAFVSLGPAGRGGGSGFIG